MPAARLNRTAVLANTLDLPVYEDSASADAFEFSQRAIQGVGQHIPRDFPEADRLGLAHGRAPAIEATGELPAGVGLLRRETFGDAALRLLTLVAPVGFEGAIDTDNGFWLGLRGRLPRRGQPRLRDQIFLPGSIRG